MPWLCSLIQFKPVPLCSRGFNWSNNGNSKRIHHCHEWEGPLSKPKYALLLTANGWHWLVLTMGCGTSCPPAIHQNWTPTVRHLWLNYETDEDRTNWIHKIWFPWEEAVECGWTYGGGGIHFIFIAQKKRLAMCELYWQFWLKYLSSLLGACTINSFDIHARQRPILTSKVTMKRVKVFFISFACNVEYVLSFNWAIL